MASCVTPKKRASWATRLRPASSGLSLDPPPPEDLFWLRIASAEVPPRTSGGQLWDEVGGWPDPYGVLRVDGEQALRTSAITDTVSPEWSDAPGGNFELPLGARLELSVHDDDALKDPVMAHGRLARPGTVDIRDGQMTVDIGKTGSRGHILLEVDRAHALLGLGFDYELFESRAVVSRLFEHGPASRVGLTVKDEILSVGGVPLSKLKARGIRSALNEIEGDPVAIIVKHPSGTTEKFRLSQGPCYPLYEEYGPVP